MKHYFATVLPGLESLLKEEINVKLVRTKIVGTTRGKVFIKTTLNLEQLKTLKLADNIYQVISQFKIGFHRKDLQNLYKQIYQLDLKPFLKKGSFYVNVSRKGSHTYSRFEAGQKAMEGIKNRYPHRQIGTANSHDMEFRLDIENSHAVFSLKLTDATYRFRQNNKVFTAASLLPTVAHAMVWLSNPKKEDVFIDPCCGSGTILSERLSYPFTYVGGGDIDKNTVSTAKMNLKNSFAEVTQWDARELVFTDDSISKIVTNLPFGRQISFGAKTEEVNLAILTEIYRVLANEGTAVVLSEGWSKIVQEAKALGFSLIESYNLSLKGLHPTIYVFRKVL
ncbi:class I SAM-dependent methyltransferase [Enterococcus cecorum]|uniref:Methyltransferase domain-containing protein n=1 Tax=Enterococcus cecorum TaxID=44008 RepID=A0AAW8TUW3_9ENTE|nr:THUMP domain-containing protein [Enterococcus cecorum]MDT2797865.1 methyltransferase domain-containing protein [Enterococcus cecorum]